MFPIAFENIRMTFHVHIIPSKCSSNIFFEVKTTFFTDFRTTLKIVHPNLKILQSYLNLIWLLNHSQNSHIKSVFLHVGYSHCWFSLENYDKRKTLEHLTCLPIGCCVVKYQCFVVSVSDSLYLGMCSLWRVVSTFTSLLYLKLIFF